MRIALSFVLLSMLVAGARAQQAPPARVVVAAVGEQQVSQSVRMEGIVDFDRVAAVAPEVSGRIDAHSLIEGTRVSRGDALVEINADFLRKDIDITRREQQEVDAEIRRLKSNLGRLEKLLRTDAASRSAYDDALYAHQAQARKRDVLSERIARLELEIEKSTVRAPFDGLVLERLSELGEWTSPESPVARIAATDDVVVKVAVSEELLRYTRPDTRVDLDIPALDEQIEGVIIRVTPVADLRSKSVALKIRVPYHPAMVQNMSARVHIPTSESRNLRTLRRDALVKFKGQDFVYTIEDDKAKMLPVNIVSRMGELVAVDNTEIRPGMEVVVDGNDRLRPDQPVQVIEHLP